MIDPEILTKLEAEIWSRMPKYINIGVKVFPHDDGATVRFTIQPNPFCSIQFCTMLLRPQFAALDGFCRNVVLSINDWMKIIVAKGRANGGPQN